MIIVFHVKPNAKVTKVVGHIDDHAFAIALHAPATEGKANEELIEYLHDVLRIPKSRIILKRGVKSRIKHIEVPEGTSMEGLRRLLPKDGSA